VCLQALRDPGEAARPELRHDVKLPRGWASPWRTRTDPSDLDLRIETRSRDSSLCTHPLPNPRTTAALQMHTVQIPSLEKATVHDDHLM